MKNIIDKSLNIVFGLILSLIFVLLLFFHSIDYVTKKTFLLPNFGIVSLILITVLLLFTIYYYYKKHASIPINKLHLNIDKIVGIFSIFLFLGQIYVFYNIFFLTDWDVAIIRNNANFIINKDYESIEGVGSEYFSVYPNNLLLTFINALILKLNSVVGIFKGEYSMMSCTVINCVINTLTCWLVYKTIALFSKKHIALLGYIIAVLLFGISPWSVIFYSDSVGIILPMLSIYLYSNDNKKCKHINKLLSVISAMVGYFIKPQCVIVLIAFIIIELTNLLKDFNIKRLIKPASLILASILCFCVLNTTINFTAQKIGYEIDETRKLGATHFFMMGLNAEDGGVYSQNDINYSRYFSTVEERQKANIEVAVDRIKTLGVGGLAKHISKKMLIAFNDGTFAWDVDGTFFKFLQEDLNSKMSPFLKSIYYKGGTRYDLFHLFSQTIWLFVLIFTFASVFEKPHNDCTKQQTNIIKLTIIGLILFEVLFEVRARYLYIYTPFFAILATMGFANFFTKFNSIICKLNKKTNENIDIT